MPSSGPRKRYPINQSPLFRLKGKGQFEAVLGLKWEAVGDLLASESYRCWANDKGRPIQAPIHWMAAVHVTIARLLARIEVPDYVYSQKGRSYVDNAAQHRNGQAVVKTDVRSFYPSVTRAMVFRVFREQFECASDVAAALADICCFEQKHLPTGSALSGSVAFFAARPMFDKIDDRAKQAGCKLTVYVDDITISGPKATKELLGEVRTLIAEHGFKSKGKKSKAFAPGSPTPITGTVVVNGEVRLPNERHRKIHEARRKLKSAPVEEQAKLRNQLTGRLQEAAQVRKVAI